MPSSNFQCARISVVRSKTEREGISQRIKKAVKESLRFCCRDVDYLQDEGSQKFRPQGFNDPNKVSTLWPI